MRCFLRYRIEFFLALAILVVLPACSVNVKKGDNGQDKKVDIETPVGGIHVSNGADARDTGLAVYPGAREREGDGNGNDKSANVNLSFGSYGLKVVALQYESDDPTKKVITFYADQLKRYGRVLECHSHSSGGHVNVHHSESNALSCEDDSGPVVELKVGTEDNQRIVRVEEQGKGSKFALVRVQMRSEKDTI
jgi:hypothetical protein